MATIENVFAVIEGEEEPDRYVILGNHPDAWTSLGRAAPGGGKVPMLRTCFLLIEGLLGQWLACSESLNQISVLISLRDDSFCFF